MPNYGETQIAADGKRYDIGDEDARTSPVSLAYATRSAVESVSDAVADVAEDVEALDGRVTTIEETLAE